MGHKGERGQRAVAGTRRGRDKWAPGTRLGLRALHHLAEDIVDVRELGALAAVLLPAVEHELVQGRLAVRRGRQAKAVLHRLHHLQSGAERQGDSSETPKLQTAPKPGSWEALPPHRPPPATAISPSGTQQGTHILVGHVPVGSLAIGHDFPHDDAKAPHVAGRAEVVILDGFGG